MGPRLVPPGEIAPDPTSLDPGIDQGIDPAIDAVVDQGELRRTLGMFLTGVTLVTTRGADGQYRGFTANSFTSVSLDPPLILVCIDRAGFGYSVFAEATHFAVNILSADQQALSDLFASKRADKFDDDLWQAGPGGSPILANAIGWLACATDQRVPAGDHLILIGRVLALGHQERGDPLGYHGGHYVRCV